jgi:hypothetical protein
VSVEAILERERRLAPRAATCAILAPVLILGSLIAAGRLGLPTSGVSTEQIRAFDANQGALLVIVVVRSIGFLLLIPPLLFLYEAIGARRPGLPRAMVGFTFLGPGLLALQGIFGWIGQAQVASDYISQYQTGGDVYTLLDDLTNDSSLSTVGQSLILPAILGLCVAMVYFPLQAQRVGLITRFFGTLGMALGAATLLFATLTLLPDTFWFLWLGLVFIGRTPRGRPPAWDAGKAIPWPRAGEAPADVATEPAVVEGDAGEVFAGDAERDHSERRERARKRKRKRRR